MKATRTHFFRNKFRLNIRDSRRLPLLPLVKFTGLLRSSEFAVYIVFVTVGADTAVDEKSLAEFSDPISGDYLEDDSERLICSQSSPITFHSLVLHGHDGITRVRVNAFKHSMIRSLPAEQFAHTKITKF